MMNANVLAVLRVNIQHQMCSYAPSGLPSSDCLHLYDLVKGEYGAMGSVLAHHWGNLKLHSSEYHLTMG